MPVILNVITEATGARGGRLLQDGEEVGWVGDLNGTSGVEFDMSAGDETTTMKLVLHPPEAGFGEETTNSPSGSPRRPRSRWRTRGYTMSSSGRRSPTS